MPTIRNNAINGPDPVEVSNGGTGQVVLAQYEVLAGNGTANVFPLGLQLDGYLAIGKTGDFPQVALPTSTGGTVTITPGPGTLNFEVAGGAAIDTIQGDIGSVTGATVSIKGQSTAGASVFFSGSGTAMVLDVTDAAGNVLLGFDAGVVGTITTANSNTGVGENVMRFLTSGQENTCIGNGCGERITADSFNTAIGLNALSQTTGTAQVNTALGTNSLLNLESGNNNVCVGYNSGANYATNESSNICIGSQVAGTASENTTTRIGNFGTQTACYIAGIASVTTSNSQFVTIDTTTGHLGSTSGGTTIGQTITGNTGGALSPTAGNWNIVTSNSVPVFAGSGSTLTLNFALTDNLLLGSSGSGITTGNTNVGYGKLAAASLTSGASNCFIGYESGVSFTTGSNSTAVGAFSMFSSIAGASNNTAIGYSSLYNLAGAGTNNTCLGLNSATAYTTTESNNIVIGSTGVIADNNKIRIGTNGTHNATFITGIDGVNVGSVAKVVTEASDQLGTAVITAGSGITVTPGANLITIAATAGGSLLPWTDVTGGTVSLAVNNGYTLNNAGSITATLPATAAYGSIIQIVAKSTGLGVIAQNAGQTIYFSSTSHTTTGATGTLTFTSQYGSIELLCTTADNDFVVLRSSGTFTLV